MISDESALKTAAGWEGSGCVSRAKLLSSLQKYVRNDFMIPEARLDSLMIQALEHQTSKCLYHNVEKDRVFSLYQDHICDR